MFDSIEFLDTASGYVPALKDGLAPTSPSSVQNGLAPISRNGLAPIFVKMAWPLFWVHGFEMLARFGTVTVDEGGYRLFLFSGGLKGIYP